nr:unnamed protein product [Digitaria exilis]
MAAPLLLLLVLAAAAPCGATTVAYNDRAVVIDGQRRIILSGSIHYPRSTPEMWPDLIRKAKEGGLNTIETYYNFEGNYDIVRYFKEIQNAGMHAILRIGPYICGEWNYGGLPAWLRDIPGVQFRLHNEPFEIDSPKQVESLLMMILFYTQWQREMETFTTLIVNKMKDAKMFAGQGGPVILAQIENEYGNIMGKLNNNQSASQYIHWCADMANKQKVGVPWIMCQQDDDVPHNVSPVEILNYIIGFKAWDKPDFHRSAEDIAFAVAMFFQKRGSVQNYYMYHGGTNFGRTSGGPYITTSYDYDAPLDEYGNIRQPKYGHLKDLHNVTKYTYGGSSVCFINNQFDDRDVNVTLGVTHLVPAWSVSILPDCKTVAYNTAKIKTQTSVMVRKANTVEKEPETLQWSWMPENLRPFMTDDRGSFRQAQLLEQIATSTDQSDYLWYRTSLEHKGEGNYKLYVNTTGHEIYAFVNGNLVGKNHSANGAFVFQLETPVKLQSGKNYISHLSGTVGLKNYGPLFELMPAGIAGGPVKLMGTNGTSIDLTNSTWSYKATPSQQSRPQMAEPQWPFTWYKTTFAAPAGEEAVVVDLLGLNKGAAWVNGHSLGRYWPSYTAADMDVCHVCDYRGKYKAEGDGIRCLTGCGEPSQRFYHVPRAFLRSGEPNTLVLFEEAGGDPARAAFHTVAVGHACVAGAEVGDDVTLSESCTVKHAAAFAGTGCESGKLTVQATC